MTTEEQSPSNAELTTLLDFLEETPHKLSRITNGLSLAEFCLKPSADEFSALENLCHLRDLELQGYSFRIRRMLGENDPALPDFDGARVAVEGNYRRQQPDLALKAFQSARSNNVQILRGLTQEQLGREGTLEGVGKISLGRLAVMMREHDEGHLEDLRVLRQGLEKQRSVSS